MSVLAVGCGNSDKPAAAADTSIATPSADSSTSAEQPSSGTDSSTTAPATAPVIPLGPPQSVTTSDGTSLISVGSPSLFTDAQRGTRALLVPVTIDVQSGTITASSDTWSAITASGIALDGTTSNTIPTAVGTGDLTGHIEGTVYISGSRSGTNYLTDDVAITQIVLTAPYGSRSDAPLATWSLPEPIAVPDLPRRQQ